MNRKLFASVAFSFMVLVLSGFLASGFGVTSPYWEENPLILPPGGSEEIELELQNMVGGEDIVLKASITRGEDVARLIDRNLEYSVPFGRKDIKSRLLIEIPEDALLGQEYEVRVFFQQVSSGEGEMVQIRGGVSKSLKVISGEVVKESENSDGLDSTLIIGLISAVLIVSLLFYFIMYRGRGLRKQESLNR